MSKDSIRRRILSERKEVGDKGPKSEALQQLLFSRLMMHRYDRVHCYLSTHEEVDTGFILKALKKDFPVDIYIPKAHRGGKLSHFKFSAELSLQTNNWGIKEPKGEGISSEEFFHTDDDLLIIVPLLAYDKNGNRLGYGKGFYDRFLAKKTAQTTTVGLSFFEPEIDFLPINETDIPLDYVCTPSRIWDFTL